MPRATGSKNHLRANTVELDDLLEHLEVTRQVTVVPSATDKVTLSTTLSKPERQWFVRQAELTGLSSSRYLMAVARAHIKHRGEQVGDLCGTDNPLEEVEAQMLMMSKQIVSQRDPEKREVMLVELERLNDRLDSLRSQ